MHVDIPVEKKCCFCLSLRLGLVVWGYLKMVIDGIVLTVLYFASFLYIALLQSLYEQGFAMDGTIQPAILSVFIALIIISIVLNILFIIGCLMKNVHLMKGFYYYGYFLMSSVIIADSVYYGYLLQNLSSVFWLSIIYLVIQYYFQILVRSEIIKLNDQNKNRFIVNIAVAESKLIIGDKKEQSRVIAEEIEAKCGKAMLKKAPDTEKAQEEDICDWII
ncbi:uncharacterized protein LOC142977155 [Anticarsia gemmatalis]|uniref:uncharacterized protein LOC142977155 n=1 Tax=Anticarsia gemmatalis TaxID=129554 RepID=UPI003F768437